MTALTARLPGLRARRTGGNQRAAYLYLVPAFIVMGFITIYPLLYQVYMSFTDTELKHLNIRLGLTPDFVGLQNYVDILTSALAIPNFDFLRIIIYNLWWALSNVALHLILGVGIALLLNSRGLWLRKFYRAMYIIPVVIPPIIVANVWAHMFDPDGGAINLLLAGVGSLIGMPASTFHIDWLRQVAPPFPGILPSVQGGPDLSLPLAYYAMLITNTWLGWPLNSVVATGALQSIPNDLYEAADMDGASSWQKFRNVTLAYLRPAMVPYAIYGFVITFNLFHLAFFMSQGGPNGKTQLLVTQAYYLVNSNQLYGVGAAFAVIMFFILLVITLITNRLTRATQTYSL
jgi:arabinogalactan oligomer/maltooligosaccharide transport system permease protein